MHGRRYSQVQYGLSVCSPPIHVTVCNRRQKNPTVEHGGNWLNAMERLNGMEQHSASSSRVTA